MNRNYAEYAWQQAETLLAIDSPSGFTRRAASWLQESFTQLGFAASITTKGGILIDLGGTDSENGLLLEAHTDTLGGMVCQIKSSGRLQLTKIGGMRAENGEAENVRIYTREGRIYEGTLQLYNASVHVNGGYGDAKRDFDTTEVVLDEDVSSVEDVRKLGIEVGDFVCFEPRTRRTYIHITVYEEVGHGGAGSVPAGVTEAISVDMGCVGEGLSCTERQVSICAKDSGGPYSYDVVGKLIAAAKATGADYAVDVYPHYGSDVEATLNAGFDLRHGLIGPGVYASHGYERSHMDGVYNTLLVLKGYLEV